MLSANRLKSIKKIIFSDNRLPIIFDSLGDPTRFQIFKLLLEQHDLCVTDFARVLDISVPAASQHLKILELSGLVTRSRMGQMTCFKVKKNDPIIRSLTKIIH